MFTTSTWSTQMSTQSSTGQFKIERQTDIPLSFEGDLLADETSRDTPDQQQWQEIRIYRTATGKYVTEMVGQTVVPGQRVFRTVNVYDDAGDVRQGLYRVKNGRKFLNDLALDALRLAGDVDPEIRDSLVAETI